MDFVKYKAEREGISVEFIDPKNTSKECSKCHHISDANRRAQNHFECESCHYTAHADHVGATNIRLRGLYVQEDGLSDIARSPIGFQTGNIDSLPDAVLNSNL
jgi:transposase